MGPGQEETGPPLEGPAPQNRYATDEQIISPLESALEYAAGGWKVFPCDPSDSPKTSKKPLNGSEGFHRATTDLAQIRRWWKQYPDALIGHPIPPGEVVIDIDPRNGGTTTWTPWEEKLGGEPDTLTTITPSGGVHYRFTETRPLHPQDNSGKRFGPGVDTRTGGKGYVILPGSVNSRGQRWEWANPETLIAALPEILAAVLVDFGEPEPERVPPFTWRSYQTCAVAAKILNTTAGNVAMAQHGTRHGAISNAAVAIGGYVAEGCLDQQHSEQTLIEAGIRSGHNGADYKHIEDDVLTGIAKGISRGQPEHRQQFHTEPLTVTVVGEPPEDLGPDLGEGPEPRSGRDLDLDDFLNVDEPEHDWIIPGLIERGDRCIFTGSEGIGKSTLLRQIAVTTASGIHPFTGDEIDPQRVILIDLENSRRHVREKMRTLRPIAGDRLQPRQLIPLIRPEGLDLHNADDQKWVTARIEANRPDLLIIGPLYKLAGGDPNAEEPAKATSALLDQLRTRHGFAIFIEAHSPHGVQGVKGFNRTKRPYGASLWLRWPEFGLHLGDSGQLSHWRGARDERQWPSYLTRGGVWPFTVPFDRHAIIWAKIVAYAETQIFRPSVRLIEAAITEPRSTIQRVLDHHADEWTEMYPDEDTK